MVVSERVRHAVRLVPDFERRKPAKSHTSEKTNHTIDDEFRWGRGIGLGYGRYATSAADQNAITATVEKLCRGIGAPDDKKLHGWWGKLHLTVTRAFAETTPH